MEDSAVNPLKVSVDPKDPKLLDYIKEQFLDPEVTGEDNNKLLLFLVACSSVTSNPLSAIVKGPSGAGKSHLVNSVLDIFRTMGHVIGFSRITPAYLENMAKKNPDRKVDLTGKILFIDELRGIQNSQAPKLLISEGRLRLGTVSENRESVEVEVKGTPTIITTTTQPALEDPEFENRVIPIQIDETEEQTRAVIEHEAQRFLDPIEDLSRLSRLESIADFLNSLLPFKVANPFASLIAKDYPVKNIEARRDYRKLMALSDVVTWLYQKQRKTGKKGIDMVLVTDLEDVEKVKTLGLVALRESLAGLSEKEQALVDFAKASVQEEVSDGKSGLEESGGLKRKYEELTVKQFEAGVRKKVRHGKTWIRDHIRRIAEEGYLEPVEQNKTPYTWRYSELQPERLNIQTENYSNTIQSTWAEEYGYQLSLASARAAPIPALPEPVPESKPNLGTLSESVREIPHALTFERGNPGNEVARAHAPSAYMAPEKRETKPSVLEKDLCRLTFASKYQGRIKGILILASPPVAATCEDCGQPSEIRVRIPP